MRITVILILLLGTAGFARAQETTGGVRGTVLDPQGLSVPGATVAIAGPQGTAVTHSAADGRFSFPFLTPGTYSVRAELSGFRPSERTGIVVSLGTTVTVPITLTVGSVSEAVTVQATGMIDTRSATAPTVISSDFLETVPVGRRLADTLYLLPGVSGSNTAGRMNPSIAGGSGLDNEYIVDGVNVTSVGFGGLGSFSSIFRSLGNATPFDFIKDVELKHTGNEAEFGQSLGGVVNVVTKSGSNDVRASLFGYSRPQSLEATWRVVDTPNGTVQTVGTRGYDAGATGGGPIVRGKLFVFGAFDPAREVQTFRAPLGFPLVTMGGVPRVRDAMSYSAKLTYQLNGRHRIDASFFGDPSNGREGAQRPTSLLAQTTAQFSTLSWGGHNQTVRYAGALSPSWFVEASYGRALNDFAESPDVDTWQFRDQTVVPNVRSGGIGAYEPGNHGVDNQFAVKATNVWRGHEFKAGFEHDRADWSQLQSYTGPTFTAPNGLQTTSGAIVRIIADPTYGRIYRVSNAFLASGALTTQTYQSAFVQDAWRLAKHVSINAGVRLDRQTIDGNVISGWSLGNNVAPRLGVAWDPGGDGRTKVFGNWGRFYARVPNDLAARTLSGESVITRSDYFDAGLTRAIPDGTLAGGVTNHFTTVGGAASDAVDPTARLPYFDGLGFGVEREVMRGTTLTIRYSYRTIGRIIEDSGNCPIVGLFLPQTAAACGHVTSLLTNPSSATAVNPDAIAAYPPFANVSFTDPVHKYHAVDVAVQRRISRNWSGLAWYRWSRLRGNYEGFYRDDTGQSDPGISTLYDFPQNDPTFTAVGTPLGGFLGDIRYQADPNGILPLDRPNHFRLLGSYAVSGLNVGLSLSGNSGMPLTPLAPHPVPGYTGGEIPLAPRGSGIQTVDGFKTRSPFTTQVDAQFAYELKLNAVRRLTLVADIFNVFNQQAVQSYDMWTALTFGGPPNPNYGQPTSSVLNVAGPMLQAPRQIRLGARFNF